jgi:hypothetical protein
VNAIPFHKICEATSSCFFQRKCYIFWREAGGQKSRFTLDETTTLDGKARNLFPNLASTENFRGLGKDNRLSIFQFILYSLRLGFGVTSYVTQHLC